MELFGADGDAGVFGAAAEEVDGGSGTTAGDRGFPGAGDACGLDDDVCAPAVGEGFDEFGDVFDLAVEVGLGGSELFGDRKSVVTAAEDDDFGGFADGVALGEGGDEHEADRAVSHEDNPIAEPCIGAGDAVEDAGEGFGHGGEGEA